METRRTQDEKNKAILINIIASGKRDKEFTDTIISSIKDFSKALIELGEAYSEEEERALTDYFQGLYKYITSIKIEEAISHLNSEKAKFRLKIIQTNITKNGYDRKIYQAIIDVAIDPFIALLNEAGMPPSEVVFAQMESVPIQQEKESVDVFPVKVATIEKDIPIVKLIALPEGFTRISCDATKEQIEKYFSILAKEKNKAFDLPYMTQENVDILLRKNFNAFEDCPTAEYLPINLENRQKSILAYFIFQFWMKYEIKQIGTKPKYVNFLIWNFESFKNDKYRSIYCNMNKYNAPSKDDIIPIENYLNL